MTKKYRMSCNRCMIMYGQANYGWNPTADRKVVKCQTCGYLQPLRYSYATVTEDQQPEPNGERLSDIRNDVYKQLLNDFESDNVEITTYDEYNKYFKS